MCPLRDDEDRDVLEGSRILTEISDWHEDQTVAWKMLPLMRVASERDPSMPSWDHPFGHSGKNVDECIPESLPLARYGHESAVVVLVQAVGAPSDRSMYPKE